MRIHSLRFKLLSYLFSICLITCLLSSCTKKAEKIPADVIPKDTMVNVLMDIHIAEAGLKSVPQDTLNPQNIKTYYDAIYKKYNTNDSVFNKSLKFYTDHPDLLENIYQKIIEEMSKKEAEVLK